MNFKKKISESIISWYFTNKREIYPGEKQKTLIKYGFQKLYYNKQKYLRELTTIINLFQNFQT